MSLVFPYHLVPIPQSAVALGGRSVRPRPLVNVGVIGPTGTIVRLAVLDTAADDTVFEEREAARLGLDLSAMPTNIMAGVGLIPYTVRYAQVTLRLTDGIEYREWPAWVGFTSARLNQPLLGFAGCLQFFSANFRGFNDMVTGC
jgi:hypothetical protein